MTIEDHQPSDSDTSHASNSSVRRLLFISTNRMWGGAEYLWFEAVKTLAKSKPNVQIAFTASYLSTDPLHRDELTAHGAKWLPWSDASKPKLSRWKSLVNRLLPYSRQFAIPRMNLFLCLDQFAPDAVVFSNGCFGQTLTWGTELRQRLIPYVILDQLVAEYLQMWIRNVHVYRECYRGSSMNCFVSQNNVTLATNLLGMRIPNVAVVRNPVIHPVDHHPMVDTCGTVHVACVARLDAFHKGQDLLLHVLARQRWRQRQLQVSFAGDGQDRMALMGLAELLNVGCVRFLGACDDVNSIYCENQLFVLPSRMEGHSIALLEAMMAGRVCVVTDVGGAKEVIQDGINGFLAEAATVDAMDRALERAWDARAAWPQIGAAAARDIRHWYAGDPIQDFISLLAKAFGDASLARS